MGPIYIRRNGACKITDTNLGSHTHSAFILAREIIPKPKFSVSKETITGYIYHLPSYNSWERGIASSNTKERPEILHSRSRIGYIDSKSHNEHSQTQIDKRRTHFQSVGVSSEEVQDDGWCDNTNEGLTIVKNDDLLAKI